MMDLPLFPLHTVLCPGVALPLHVFEERYKTMVERCLAAQSPFGVVLIREGREVGPGDLAVAGVGTVAEIREATRYADGRYDLVTLGTQRFRLEGVDPGVEPYLVGQITPLEEELGEAARARALGELVIRRFIRYLELLQVEEEAKARPRRRGRRGNRPSRTEIAADAASPAVEPEPESHGTPWALQPEELAEALDAGIVSEGVQPEAAQPVRDVDSASAAPNDPGSDEAAADRARAEFLDEAARRLTIPDDPTVLSYLLSGIVQVESLRRQGLLEMPTTEKRLEELAHLLDREIALLDRGLGSYVPDPRLSRMRRN